MSVLLFAFHLTQTLFELLSTQSHNSCCVLDIRTGKVHPILGDIRLIIRKLYSCISWP